MSAMFELDSLESRTPLSVCPRCGRQVRIDGHCDCEDIFLAENYRKPGKK